MRLFPLNVRAMKTNARKFTWFYLMHPIILWKLLIEFHFDWQDCLNEKNDNLWLLMSFWTQNKQQRHRVQNANSSINLYRYSIDCWLHRIYNFDFHTFCIHWGSVSYFKKTPNIVLNKKITLIFQECFFSFTVSTLMRST